MGQLPKNKKIKQEKLFSTAVPSSQVQLKLVKQVKATINIIQAKKSAKIINYQAVKIKNGEYYLSLEQLNLKPLTKYLTTQGIDSQKLLLEFRQIFKTLTELELIKKLFPKGMKPDHFWIDASENIYLMPESILKVKENYCALNLELPGAEYFRPPEIISASNWQLEAYLFNLAAILYYFLTQTTIFTDQDKAKVLTKIQTEKILKVKALNHKISSELNKLIMEMLNKKQEKRPNLEVVLASLETIAEKNKLTLKFGSITQKSKPNKLVQNKRRNEKIKLFFRQSWKVLLFFVLVFGALIWSLFSGPKAAITEKNTPVEVVNYFYQGVANKNISLAQVAVDFELDQLERLIVESHVIEKMQSAYSSGDAEKEIKRVYQLKNLKVKNLSAAANEYKFEVKYNFSYQNQSDNYNLEAKDQLLVKQVKGVWKIIKIDGNMKTLIAGNYPGRENNGSKNN